MTTTSGNEQIRGVRAPAWSPWGAPQASEMIGHDIWVVVTAGHGGLNIGSQVPASLQLPRAANDCFINGSNWAEEDCEIFIALALLFDGVEVWLTQHWPSLVEQDDEGVPKVFALAASICNNYGDYLNLAPYVAGSRGRYLSRSTRWEADDD